MALLDNPRGHIVFDCDGTLISSFESIVDGVKEVMSITLKREVTREEVIEKYTADLYGLAKNFGIELEGDEAKQKELIGLWEEVVHRNNEARRHQFLLYPGIKELLDELKKEYQLYVWTARDRRSTLFILRDLGVVEYFLDFSCVDDDNAPKPMPDGIERMVGDFDKSKVVVIGDSPGDIRGAKAYGAKSIAACWDHPEFYENSDNYGADFKTRDPLDCLSIINSLM